MEKRSVASSTMPCARNRSYQTSRRRTWITTNCPSRTSQTILPCSHDAGWPSFHICHCSGHQVQRVESESGGNIAADQGETNRFVDVHEKIKAFKDRVLQANNSDAQVFEVKSAKRIADTCGSSK